MNKEKLLELLGNAADNAGGKTGIALSMSEIDALYDDLSKVDPSKVNQWIALNKDKLGQIPELAGNAAIIDISESPKTVEKDYGFTESDDFYKMEGPKSWMNKSVAYLQQNAKKYGMELPEYLNIVRDIATQKERERQWKENATVAEFKDLPLIGDVSIPGLTSIMLPTSFNKAAMGKDVTAGDIAYDIIADELEGAMAVTPFKGKAQYVFNPVVAALTGNTARQGKQLYDETQDEFHTGELAGAGAMGAFGTPILFKTAADVVKRIPGTQGIKPVQKFARGLEDIGEKDPSKILEDKVNELTKSTNKYRAAKANQDALHEDAINQIAFAIGEKQVPDIMELYKPYNPTPLEAKLYGKGSKLWRNVKNGEILTDKEYQEALNFLKEANRGPEFIPGKQRQSRLYERGVKIKNMPEGDILINAWSEPRIMTGLRQEAKAGSGIVGGRSGIAMSEQDKKALANKIINSAEWGKYITGLPNNLTEEEIYLASEYGDK